MSSTRVAVEADPGGIRARVRLREGLLRPGLLSCDHRGAKVALTAIGALLLTGDEVRLDVAVGPGAWMEIVEPAGTVAYDMRGGRASWEVRVRLERDARLCWQGQPFVVAEGARVRRDTRVTMAAGSVCCLRETLVLGRAGEGPGQLDSRLRATWAGRPLLAEDVCLGPSSAVPGLLGDDRVLDTIYLLGVRAPETADALGAVRLDLEAPGTCLRTLGTALHRSPLSDAWSSWSRATPM